MPITTIAVHIEAAEMATVEARTALPIALARAHEAHVTALVFKTNVLEGSDVSSSGQALDEDEDTIARRVRDLLEGAGVRSEVRNRSSFAYGIGEVFADQMRVSDIGMMAFPHGAPIGAQFIASGGIFSSGRPLLLYPAAEQSKCARIAIAWDASPAAVRAVHGAMPLIRKAETVTVLCITDDKEFRQGQSGAELTHLLARHGATAEFQSLRRGRSSIGGALEDAARGARADLLVMGAVGHSRLHNIVYGSATKDLLENGRSLPTLVAA